MNTIVQCHAYVKLQFLRGNGEEKLGGHSYAVDFLKWLNHFLCVCVYFFVMYFTAKSQIQI